MIPIDGSHGEGGGQILRTALSLSALTGRSVRVTDIRAGRPRPGLAAQHLAAVRAAADVCGARIGGSRRGSLEVWFEPGSPRAGTYRFEVGTAGSACLVLQTVVVPLAFARGESAVTVTGGTHVPWSPPFEFLAGVWAEAVRRFGIPVDVSLGRAGFYPRGGGEVRCRVGPARPPLEPVRLTEPGRLLRVRGVAGTAGLPGHVGRRMAGAAREALASLGVPVEVEPRCLDAPSPGAYLVLVAECGAARLSASALGERGKPAERVGEEAAEELRARLEAGSAVDPHLADQILLPAALAGGTSEYTVCRITRHLATNAWVIGRILPEARIWIEGSEGGPGRVVVEGAGWEPGR